MAGLLCCREGQLRFVILTNAAEGKLAEIHHRQPLVLGAGDESNWLGGSADQASTLCKAAPASWFNWYRVSPEVGKVAVDDPRLVKPSEEAGVEVALTEQGDLFD